MLVVAVVYYYYYYYYYYSSSISYCIQFSTLWFYCEALLNIEWNLGYTNSFFFFFVVFLLLLLLIGEESVNPEKNPFLAIFRQGSLQFYDSIFGQTIFRFSDWTAKNQL